jgi:hypothetical protein
MFYQLTRIFFKLFISFDNFFSPKNAQIALLVNLTVNYWCFFLIYGKYINNKIYLYMYIWMYYFWVYNQSIIDNLNTDKKWKSFKYNVLTYIWNIKKYLHWSSI